MPLPGGKRQGGPPDSGDGTTKRQPYPPVPGGGGDGLPPSGTGRSRGTGRKRRRPRFGRVLLSIVLVLFLLVGAVWAYLEFSIDRVDALSDYPDRPAAAAGTNYLLVGSDSREDMTKQEQEKFHTGGAGGARTDTIMIAHVPDNDVKPTLVSLPRDSIVQIPGHGSNKINAAFSLGGASLLTRTVEQATDLRIDHYVEVGFIGFAGIVDAVGGVEMQIPEKMHDTKTGVTIPAGKQTLDGVHALGFVRMRHSSATPRSDLDRIANQRKFIGALADEIASPATLLNPFDVVPLIGATPDAVTMDEGDHLHNLVALGWAMRGVAGDGVVTTSVPTGSGAEQWLQPATDELFDALRDDTEVPESAISQ